VSRTHCVLPCTIVSVNPAPVIDYCISITYAFILLLLRFTCMLIIYCLTCVCLPVSLYMDYECVYIVCCTCTNFQIHWPNERPGNRVNIGRLSVSETGRPIVPWWIFLVNLLLVHLSAEPCCTCIYWSIVSRTDGMLPYAFSMYHPRIYINISILLHCTCMLIIYCLTCVYLPAYSRIDYGRV
jgi:hypothetical protein